MEIAFYWVLGGSAAVAVVLGIIINAMEHIEEKTYSSGSKPNGDKEWLKRNTTV